MYCGVAALIVIVMFARNTYNMNKQCNGVKKYYSLGMEFNCGEKI